MYLGDRNIATLKKDPEPSSGKRSIIEHISKAKEMLKVISAAESIVSNL